MILLVAEVREALRREFFVRASVIPLDILIAVASAPETSYFGVKQLMASLPHSPTGIRYHLGHLVDDGWLRYGASPFDRRVRTLHPTDKTLEAFNRAAVQVKMAVEQLDDAHVSVG